MDLYLLDRPAQNCLLALKNSAALISDLYVAGWP